MSKLQSIPQPVIAEVQGIATAAGCQLAATCDLAIASENAAFATPGVKIGLFCTTPMVALSRVIGSRRALEMLQSIHARRGLAILVVEHNLRAMMQLCSRVVVLHHGEKIGQGTPEAITRDPAVIAAYLGAA